MHEMSITGSVVALCAERAAGQQVIRVTLEIGKLAGVVPDAVRFCFEICATGTALEGAELEIIETPGRAVCRDCGAGVSMQQLYDCCACGSANLELTAGEELKIKQMEVTECV